MSEHGPSGYDPSQESTPVPAEPTAPLAPPEQAVEVAPPPRPIEAYKEAMRLGDMFLAPGMIVARQSSPAAPPFSLRAAKVLTVEKVPDSWETSPRNKATSVLIEYPDGAQETVVLPFKDRGFQVKVSPCSSLAGHTIEGIEHYDSATRLESANGKVYHVGDYGQVEGATLKGFIGMVFPESSQVLIVERMSPYYQGKLPGAYLVNSTDFQVLRSQHKG